MTDHQRSEWLHVEHSSAPNDIFGEPTKKTRIGEGYQALIPAFMRLSTQNQLKTNEGNMENQANEQDGAKGESWSVMEHASFLLGLYIFGKNLCLVNRFMGNKGMRHVLSYYYGKFCRTSEHEKWSRYRKKGRSKKTVPGKKIFTGWRQQELFSRVFPYVTDECKAGLTQASNMFENGKLSFEKYVFNVRDMVGIELLLEAVAIGKVKGDLTSMLKKPMENKKTHPVCSTLKTEEIVNLLKVRIGLSKARLSELFREAVWPRLLARGWHSEQPRIIPYQNMKNSLVFLIPGIKTFSRRSLKKGSEYFESISDVLNKVASEPNLLEPEPHQDRAVNRPAQQGSDEEHDSMQFIIVDSSLLIKEEGVLKMCELRFRT